MKDLSTRYLGLELKSPIVVSACPLSQKVDQIVEMEDCGAGAVVLFSLFEEQLQQGGPDTAGSKSRNSDSFPDSEAYFPSSREFRVDAGEYLELIRKAKERVDIPIIASLNGITDEGWLEIGKQMAQAGANALELNIYYIAADLDLTAGVVENRYIHIVRRLKAEVTIPVAVKLNPYFSAFGNLCRSLVEEGADGLVLFNRFYQPDINIESLEASPSLELSNPSEIRLPLLWTSVLFGQVDASLAASTGVHSEKEVIKYLLAGADVAMTASALYKYGIYYIRTMEAGLKEWMNKNHFDSVEQFKGMLSLQNIPDPSAFERANYIRIMEKHGHF